MEKRNVVSIVFTAMLVMGLHQTARAAIEPSCNDRELARLQASAASSNLANLYTTRTPEGGAYQKKIAVRLRNGRCEVQSVQAFRVIHEPGHPDADRQGFVKYPDISAEHEMKILTQAKEKLKKSKHTSSIEADVDVD